MRHVLYSILTISLLPLYLAPSVAMELPPEDPKGLSPNKRLLEDPALDNPAKKAKASNKEEKDEKDEEPEKENHENGFHLEKQALEEAKKYDIELIKDFRDDTTFSLTLIKHVPKQFRLKKTSFSDLLKTQPPEFASFFIRLMEQWKEIQTHKWEGRFKKCLIEKPKDDNTGELSSGILYYLLFKSYKNENIDELTIAFNKCSNLITNHGINKGDSPSILGKKKDKIQNTIRKILCNALSKEGTFRPDFLNDPIWRDPNENTLPTLLTKDRAEKPKPTIQGIVNPLPQEPTRAPLPGEWEPLPKGHTAYKNLGDREATLLLFLGNSFSPPLKKCGMGGDHYTKALIPGLDRLIKGFDTIYREKYNATVGDNSDPMATWKFNPDNLRNATDEERIFWDTLIKRIETCSNINDEQRTRALNAIIQFKALHVNNREICRDLMEASPARSTSIVHFENKALTIVLHPGLPDTSLEQRVIVFYNTVVLAYDVIKDAPDLFERFVKEAFFDTVPCLEAQSRRIDAFREALSKEKDRETNIGNLTIDQNIQEEAERLSGLIEKSAPYIKEQEKVIKAKVHLEKKLQEIRTNKTIIPDDKEGEEEIETLTTALDCIPHTITALEGKHENWMKDHHKYEELYKTLGDTLLGKIAKDGEITKHRIDIVLIEQLAWPLIKNL